MEIKIWYQLMPGLDLTDLIYESEINGFFSTRIAFTETVALLPNATKFKRVDQ